MKYVALLRGINVGGNNIVKMADLKAAVESCGFSDVSTYIQSGNVIFESDKSEQETIKKVLEECFLKKFGTAISTLVLSEVQVKKIVKQVPVSWKSKNDLRMYVAFVLPGTNPDKVVTEVQLREGVDSIATGQGVVYMTTKLGGITKSGFSNLIAKSIYKKITIRNFNTVSKILNLVTN